MPRNLRVQSRSIRIAWTSASLTIMLLLTLLYLSIVAQPARAQSAAVPPTARQAAAMPQYASRLAHAVRPASSYSASPSSQPRASFKNPANVLARGHRGGPLDAMEIYDNGPINGTTDAWTINGGFVVSDTFTVGSGGGPVNGLTFGAWMFPGDVFQTVEISITSSEFGGTTYTDQVLNFTTSGCSGNQYGFNVCTESSTNFSALNLAAGTYWVNLANAVVNNGDPIYWDENSGIGCGSQGCPSSASGNAIGTIPSEAFTILGNATTTCQYPPCQQCVQDEGNFSVIHSFTDNEGSPATGLAIDSHENLYGTTLTGGSNAEGLAYKLASIGENWIFTPLYNFIGGSSGQNPMSGIIGPDKTLYGTADGGIQNCASNGNNNYCGVVYRLRPPPTACLTALCGWNETVIYEFMGVPDGARPNGNLVFDQAGNLYGTTAEGGSFGKGLVYQLTPSGGGWTETVLHSFMGLADGLEPHSLLLGQDGNLYGTAYGGSGGQGSHGVIFQLIPSGGSWEFRILPSSGSCDSCGNTRLIQASSGNIYGIDYYPQQFCGPYGCFGWDFSQVFRMSPSENRWQFTVLDDSFYICQPARDCYYYDEGEITFSDLAVDSAGNLYSAWGWQEGGNFYQGAVFKLLEPYQEQPLAGFSGDNFRDVEVGPSGNIYGTTGACNGTYGTVWRIALP